MSLKVQGNHLSPCISLIIVAQKLNIQIPCGLKIKKDSLYKTHQSEWHWITNAILRLSKVKDPRLFASKFLYLEKLRSTSTYGIGAYLSWRGSLAVKSYSIPSMEY